MRTVVHLITGKFLIKNRALNANLKIDGICKRMTLNFGSPRTLYASKLCGICFEDCLLKDECDFRLKGVRKEVQDLRYEHHIRRVESSLIKVHQARAVIIKKEISRLKRYNKGEKEESNTSEVFMTQVAPQSEVNEVIPNAENEERKTNYKTIQSQKLFTRPINYILETEAKRSAINSKLKKNDINIYKAKEEKRNAIRKVNEIEENKLNSSRKARQKFEIMRIKSVKDHEEEFKKIDERVAQFEEQLSTKHQQWCQQKQSNFRSTIHQSSLNKLMDTQLEIIKLDKLQKDFIRRQNAIDKAHFDLSDSINQKLGAQTYRVLQQKQNNSGTIESYRTHNLHSTYKKITKSRKEKDKLSRARSQTIKEFVTQKDEKMYSNRLKVRKTFREDILKWKDKIEERQNKNSENRLFKLSEIIGLKKECNSLRQSSARENYSRIIRGKEFSRQQLTEKFVNSRTPKHSNDKDFNYHQCEQRRLSTLSNWEKEKAIAFGIALKRAQTHSEKTRLISKLKGKQWKQFLQVKSPTPARVGSLPGTANNNEKIA